MNRTNITLLIILATLAIGLTAGTASAKVIIPSEAMIDWQLDITYQSPRPIVVTPPGSVKPEIYWFFLFRVTNSTTKDIPFTPQVELLTNTGELLRAGQGVDPAAFIKVKKIYDEPRLNDVVGFSNKILQGDDNAKTCVAIFKNFDPTANTFTIYFDGLSGETTELKLPTKKDGKPQFAILSKTLELNYVLKCDARHRPQAKPVLTNKRWIMR